MRRHKSKSSTHSIFRWFYNNIAIVLGIIPPSQQHRRLLTKRFNRRINLKNPRKYPPIKKIDISQNINSSVTICKSSDTPQLPIFNNNNNLNLAYEKLSKVDQQRILCILVENDEIAECIRHASVFQNSRIMDLEQLIEFIRAKEKQNITYEDASTMTNTDPMNCSITCCTNYSTQSENVRRLKALEFIRIFIEKNQDEFCQYLINEEHLCQTKTLAIYQMIKQFLKHLYPSELVQ